MNKPLCIVVVGHTNAGKTSLLRTLTRLKDFGEVSDRPGTTRHVETKDLRVDGRSTLSFVDTPGLEDSVTLSEYLHGLGAHLTPPDRVRKFLAGPEATDIFEQEAKVLRALLDADAALYVLDTREAVLPKYRAEMDILSSCARPILPVLNFVADPQSRLAEWSLALPEHKLHGSVAFDAVAPAVGAEEALYQALVFMLPGRRDSLLALWKDIARQAAARQRSACTLIAGTLIDLAALRRAVPKATAAAGTERQALVRELRESAIALQRRAVDDLLQIHGFRQEEVDQALLPWTEGRWEADLFNPAVLREAGLKLGAGAAIGAAIGLAADVALAGLSLGAGATVGAAIGGVASQGFGVFGRRLFNIARGVQEVSLENEVLWVAARQLTGLLAVLERRGHAAQGRIAAAVTDDPELDSAMKKLIGALQQARGLGPSSSRNAGGDAQRDALTDVLRPQLQEIVNTLARRSVDAQAGAGK